MPDPVGRQDQGVLAAGDGRPARLIFELREDDVDVIQARIAERLGVSRPAVSEMIKRMEAEGLVASTAAHRPHRRRTRLAERVVRRHRLAERFLTDMLGLSWAEAHKEAGKWEHVISDQVEAAIVRVLGDPDHVPARQPHPRLGLPRARRRRPRASCGRRRLHGEPHPRGAGVHARPARVPRGSPSCCRAAGTVTAASPDGTTTVEIDGHHVGIGAFAAARILVIAD